MTKSPSRSAGYVNLLPEAIAQHGLVCYLCGQIHSRADTMQADFKSPQNEGRSGNVIPVCKTCAKRRKQSPIGSYWKKRLIDAQREIAYITQMVEDADIMARLTATVILSNSGSVEETESFGKPWENLKRRPRFYNSTTLKSDELTNVNKPKDTQHGDIFVDHDNDEEFVYDGVNKKWIFLEKAEERGLLPDVWPPANVETWNQSGTDSLDTINELWGE